MKIAFITIGESELELLCPKHGDVPGSQGVIAHLAFTVDDIEKVVDSLRVKPSLLTRLPGKPWMAVRFSSLRGLMVRF